MRDINSLRRHATLASALENAEDEFQYDWQNLPYYRLYHSSTYQYDNANQTL